MSKTQIHIKQRECDALLGSWKHCFSHVMCTVFFHPNHLKRFLKNTMSIIVSKWLPQWNLLSFRIHARMAFRLIQRSIRCWSSYVLFVIVSALWRDFTILFIFIWIGFYWNKLKCYITNFNLQSCWLQQTFCF